jgi:cobalt-zinc-cadmium efflux system protein
MTTHQHRELNEGKPAFMAALAITFGYAIIELAGGLWSNSLALVSDAGHMFSDALALGFAAGAAWLARWPETLIAAPLTLATGRIHDC